VAWILLLATIISFAAGAGAGRAIGVRRASRTASARRDELRRLYVVAETAARSGDPVTVIAAAQEQLMALLGLRGCHFEAPPFTTVLEKLDRSGAVSWQRYHLTQSGFALPAAGVELPVIGRGRVLGRFFLEPTHGRGVPVDQRVAALAIADQVGLVLAAPQPGRETRNG